MALPFDYQDNLYISNFSILQGNTTFLSNLLISGTTNLNNCLINNNLNGNNLISQGDITINSLLNVSQTSFLNNSKERSVLITKKIHSQAGYFNLSNIFFKILKG